MKNSTITIMVLMSMCILANASAELTFSIAGTMSGEGAPISGICLSPDNTKLYAACWEDSPTSRVLEYDLSNYSLSQSIGFGSYHTHGDVVLSADGRYLFTPNYYRSNLSRIDLEDGYARQDLSVGTSWPGRVNITPDKTKVLVMGGWDGRSYDMNNDAVAIFDIQNGAFTKLATVFIQDEPLCEHVAYSADSRYAYVTSYPRKSPQGVLYEISLEGTYEVTRTLSLPSTRIPAVALVGDNFYVSDSDNSCLWIIDRNTLTISSSIDLGSKPGVLALHPNGKDLYVLFEGEQKLIALDTDINLIIGEFDQLNRNPRDIEFNNDGSKVYISHYYSGDGIMELGISGIRPSVISVPVDIKPGSCPNPINTKSKGVVPVAVLGTEAFDVNDIDIASIRLEGVAPIRSSVEDVASLLADPNESECPTEGPDGYNDLTLKFETQSILSVLDDLNDGEEWELYLDGVLKDGTPFEGSDYVLILDKGK